MKLHALELICSRGPRTPAAALQRAGDGGAATSGGLSALPSPAAFSRSAAAITSMSDSDLKALIRRHTDMTWPMDRTEVPVWRLAQEERSRRCGFVLPGYRTRAEFEAAVSVATATLESVSAKTLGPDAAAHRFVAACRRTASEHRFDSDGLDAAYAAHCERERLAPHAQNVIRSALRRIPGVTTAQDNMRRGGRRHRPMIWTIGPDIPATFEHARIAA